MGVPLTYLYGIIHAGTSLPPDLVGIDGMAPVVAIECGRLAAVTSCVDGAGFEGDAPADPDWVVPRALRHELVIEKILPHGSVLPVRFGALFSTHRALAAWAAFNDDAISRYLEHVAGKDEWTIKIDVELAGAYETLISRDPSWCEKARLLSASPGTRYFQEKRLREEARRHVRFAGRLAAEKVRQAAALLAEERVLSCRNSDERDVERLVHLAYLVPRGQVSELMELVSAAAGDAPCLRLMPSGPWPPAHFCPVLKEPC